MKVWVRCFREEENEKGRESKMKARFVMIKKLAIRNSDVLLFSFPFFQYFLLSLFCFSYFACNIYTNIKKGAVV